MAITITSAFIDQFEANVIHLAQQSDTRARPWCYEVSSNGETYNFDRLNQSAAVQKTTARTATPALEPAWDRRTATPQTWHWADTVEHSDKVQMLIDPTSAYSKNAAMAMRRAEDDLIFTAALGAANNGVGGTVALPASQTIAAGGAGLTLDKITQANEILQLADIDPDVPKVMFIGPHQVRNIMNDTTLTSSDYLAVKQLQTNGMVAGFLGFTFIMSNRLALATADRSCIAMTNEAMGLAVNQDMFTRIAERADLSHAIQVYCEWTMGAVRKEDTHVVEVVCVET